jgi:hypothetical protein
MVKTSTLSVLIVGVALEATVPTRFVIRLLVNVVVLVELTAGGEKTVLLPETVKTSPFEPIVVGNEYAESL